MQIVKNILKRLNEPFPEDISLVNKIRSKIGIGIFVTLFLYILRPFGLTYYGNEALLICVKFGLVTVFAGVAYNLFSIYILGLKKDMSSWTLWKWIVSAIVLIIFISICNYLFMSSLEGWEGFSWANFLGMVIITFIVGIFPIIFSGMIIQMNAYKRNQIKAKDMQTGLIPKKTEALRVMLTDENNRNNYSFDLANLLYIEAMQNYVSVYHLTTGKIEKTIFRNTVKRIEVQVAKSPLIRCHRSFLVNTNLIEKVVGNAQGLRLTLKGLEDRTIPVSRKYIPLLKEIIN